MKIKFAPPALDVAKTTETLAEARPEVVVTPNMCTLDDRGGFYRLDIAIDMIVYSGTKFVFGNAWKDIVKAARGLSISIVVAHDTIDKEAQAVGDFSIAIEATELSELFAAEGLLFDSVFSLTVLENEVTLNDREQRVSLISAPRVGRNIGQFTLISTNYRDIDAPIGDIPPTIPPPDIQFPA